MLKRFVFILAMVVGSLYVSAQNSDSKDRFLLHGSVLEKGRASPVSYANVLISRRYVGVAANISGEFSIYVFTSDTITFSCIGYETKRFCFADSVFSEEKQLTVYLNYGTETIPVVDILPYKTYAQFKSAVIHSEPKEDPLLDAKLYLDKITKEAIRDSKAGVMVPMLSFSPITMMYDRFSKEGKSRREYEALMAADHYSEYIEKKYNKEMVRGVTGIDDDAVLKAFMDYCRISNGFIKKSSELEILCAINECYKEFTAENNELPDTVTTE